MKRSFRRPHLLLNLPVLIGAALLIAPLQAGTAGENLPELPGPDTAGFLAPIRAQIEEAVQAARAHPRDAAYAGTLGMTLHAYELYEPAVRAYSRAHLLDPQNFDWLYLLGSAQMSLGAFATSADAFRQALGIRPADLPAALRLAQSLAAMAKYGEAESLYRRILEMHADTAQAWYGLGRVQAAEGNHAAAVGSYGKACGLFASYGAAHYAMAGELRRLGRPADAETHAAAYSKNATAEPPLEDPLFRRIHELNHGVQARLQRGAELEKAGELQASIREHEAALAIDPNNVQAHVNLISLYARTGDSARAEEQFQTVARLDPGRPDAWYDYGVLLYGLHSYDRAEQAFRHAVAANPGYAEAHNNLGAIYEQQGRLDDAEKEFRAAVSARPDYPLARFHLGRILVNREKYDEAIRQFRRALEPESDQTPVYLYALGAACARSGDRSQALEYLQKAHEAAAARGQAQLLASIDRDLKALAGEP